MYIALPALYHVRKQYSVYVGQFSRKTNNLFEQDCHNVKKKNHGSAWPERLT